MAPYVQMFRRIYNQASVAVPLLRFTLHLSSNISLCYSVSSIAIFSISSCPGSRCPCSCCGWVGRWTCSEAGSFCWPDGQRVRWAFVCRSQRLPTAWPSPAVPTAEPPRCPLSSDPAGPTYYPQQQSSPVRQRKNVSLHLFHDVRLQFYLEKSYE